MAAIPSMTDATLDAIGEVLGDTNSGLTGTEIGNFLQGCGIDDVGLSTTKRIRLADALKARQSQVGCANHVISFIQAAMDPVRYTGRQTAFDDRRCALNRVIAFAGLVLGEDGKVRAGDPARTVSQAVERAGRLLAELERRRVHADVLRFCRAELLQENYFHAVLEASKSVAAKVRTKTGLTTDGSQLVDDAFGKKPTLPVLAFNSLQTESEWSEQRGLMNIMKGVFSAFRNPTAHEPRVSWQVTEQDALDLLTLASLLHRRLDAAVPTTPKGSP
jgi:uncharacterized protein (TIGR02391 family)